MPHIPDSRHADHDPLAIAAFAAGDATGAELDDALALVAACEDCAALHHELRAIAAALPALPAPVRPRDFRLTPEQAASLRPAGWRRLLAPLAGPRFAFAGPLGTGLATLGIAGFLVAGSFGIPVASSVPGGGTGNDTGLVAPSASPDEIAAKAQEAPSDAPASNTVRVDASEAPLASADPQLEYSMTGPADLEAESSSVPGAGTLPGGTGGPVAGVPQDGTAATPPDAGFGVVLPVASGLALLAGLVLAGLRLASRRLGAA